MSVLIEYLNEFNEAMRVGRVPTRIALRTLEGFTGAVGETVRYNGRDYRIAQIEGGQMLAELIETEVSNDHWPASLEEKLRVLEALRQRALRESEHGMADSRAESAHNAAVLAEVMDDVRTRASE